MYRNATTDDYVVNNFRQRLNRLNKSVTEEVNTQKMLAENIKAGEKRKAELEHQEQNEVTARELLTTATESARVSGKNLLEETTTHIVRMVFGNNYKIKIKLSVRANQPVADVFVEKKIGTHNDTINVNNEGGGLRDIISLAFFIAVAEIVGNNKAIIALDEPTPGVSVGHAESTAEAILELTKYAQKQSLIITHEREYLPNLIDRVYLVEQSADGVSKTEEL